MVTRRLIVKTESIERFFKEFGSGQSEIARSMYHFMQDEVVIKKPDDLGIGDMVVFHIAGKSLEGRFAIEHVYEYSVYEYDDLSYRLVLKDFNVVRI
ncbi:hypothetical protein H8788_14415 [Parabacteroides faecis]|uniref:hypothetical protein n=1 Tax=Parabacteroides TaxID=375288 RepID=UPI000EFECB3B|nr:MULTISPECIES: hypothetical protein [Parabacteroides]MBC8618936.1 hypothetical protein [Parabacteroides faecis]RHS00059.1 hypothetical protein DWW23_05300 [Parabacteroides sp. AF14-59]